MLCCVVLGAMLCWLVPALPAFCVASPVCTFLESSPSFTLQNDILMMLHTVEIVDRTVNSTHLFGGAVGPEMMGHYSVLLCAAVPLYQCRSVISMCVMSFVPLAILVLVIIDYLINLL